ncbi:MAG: dihydroorotase [Desulfovibrionales bacterium]
MPDYDLIIHNCLWKGVESCLLISGEQVADLLPQKEVPEGLEGNHVDAREAVLLPSLIDAHVHLREPGFEYKEDIRSGLAAAAAGGFGAVMAMANTNPVNDNRSVTEFMLDRSTVAHPDGPRLLPVGALTKGLQGKELAPLAELAQAGCIAFSNDGIPVSDSELFRRAIEYASDFGRKVIDHCEDPFLAHGGVMNEGELSSRLGLRGQPSIAESMQIARDILLASYLDAPVHLAHVSCRESVELISWAKRKGIPVTAETCPHYLLWDESLVEGYNTLAKVNPPLRTKDDVLAVREGVRTGIIDMLVTDHAPHAEFEKEVPFDQAPFGISGLDTALSLTFALTGKRILGMDDLIRCWIKAPAEVFQIEHNRFSPGDRADFLLWDPDRKWKVTSERMHSKGKNTPCRGKTLKGMVRSHYLSGRLVFSQ